VYVTVSMYVSVGILLRYISTIICYIYVVRLWLIYMWNVLNVIYPNVP